MMSFWTRVRLVLGSLLGPLGGPRRAKMGPRGAQERPKRLPDGSKTFHDDHLYAKKRVSKNIEKLKDKKMIVYPPDASKSSQDGLQCSQDGPKIAPRRLQDLPQTSSKAFLWHLLFRHRFWPVLDASWAPCPPFLGRPRRPQNRPRGPQNRYQKHPNIMLAQNGLQERSKTAQDRSKTASDPP